MDVGAGQLGAGIHAELGAEQRAPLPVHRESVAPSTGQVQRDHELGTGAFEQWPLVEERAQLGDDVVVAAQPEVGGHPVGEGGEPVLLQPDHCGRDERRADAA